MNIERTIAECESSIVTGHCALRLDANPVIVAISSGRFDTGQLTWILTQYCCFPLRIVEILGCMASSLYSWPGAHEELLDNISQECGILTKGRPHCIILRDCVKRELGINLTDVRASATTLTFLDSVVTAVCTNREDRAFVLGMSYALESSAVPELTIVAELLNAILASTGQNVKKLSRHLSMDRKYAMRLMVEKSPKEYTIEDFFAIHLLAIEVDHKEGIRKAIGRYIDNDLASNRLRVGFQFVLNVMDKWWEDLSTEVSAERSI